ncbi:HAD family hydrolase [Paenibacillus septentrionalis]|uniref:HAD family hydrolase n=1 Tax=Paenibacillus septentrionalis TaxID=429342 RepID=A0ABW1V2J8_9BACL
MYKAVFLDFYGTLVHEDDAIVPLICEAIQQSTELPCTAEQIGRYWWEKFSSTCRISFGADFQTQRTIGISSLQQTIDQFQAECNAEMLIRSQFEHWSRPKGYDDTMPFLQALKGVSVFILSNIDTSDLIQAMDYHDITADGIITSEDVRSYKPRPEMFHEALKRSGFHPHEVIHIGDSITNDVYGAHQVGIQTIWLNRLNRQLPETMQADIICTNLYEAADILINGNRRLT